MRRIALIGGLVILIGSPLQADMFTASEDVLLSSEYASPAWGPGTLSRTDAPGEAVEFSFTGLSNSGTALKDNFPVQDYGQILPSHGSGDFSLYDGYSLWLRNVGTTPVTVSLFLGTGFTGASGVPSNDWTNDTFWQSVWQGISPGETLVLTLDFDNAQAYNIWDNKPPHTQGSETQWLAINDYDRTEVSAIGFQVLGSGNGTIWIGPSTIPESSAIWLLILGFAMVVRKRRTSTA